MALSKKISLGNGIITNYHRVTSVNTITNNQNIIEVTSYTSKAKRLEEKAAIESGEPFNVFMDSQFVSCDYDQSMTVDDAYEYLKTLPEFEGATDVMDDLGDEV